MQGIGLEKEDGLYITYNKQQLLERIRRVLLTSNKERVGRPEFGSQVNDLICTGKFFLDQHFKTYIVSALTSYIPNLVITSASISYSKNVASISLKATYEGNDLNEVIKVGI